VFVQDGKLAHASFSSKWNDVVQDAFVFVQEGKLAHTSFPMGGMIFFEMH
jgi:hypothetical protein